MSRNPLSRMATLYRLEAGHELADYISRPSTLSSFELATRKVDGDDWVLVYGCLHSPNATWTSHVSSLIGQEITLPSATPYSVLLVPRAQANYALTWGAGWQFLNSDLVVTEFGRDYGLRRLDADRLRSVGTKTIDLHGRLTQTIIPSGSDLAGFAVEPVVSLLNQVEGVAHLDDLTCGKQTRRARRLQVGTSLRVPLGLTPRMLADDIASIERATRDEQPADVWRSVNQLDAIRATDPMLSTLRDRLADALGSDSESISIGWPSGIGRGALSCDSYRITGADPGHPENTNELDIGYFTERLAALPPAQRLDLMRRSRIEARDDAEDESIGSAFALRWICFETAIGSDHYLLQDGRWYRLGQDNLARLHAQIEELIENNRIHYPGLPTWIRSGRTDDENQYCHLVAKNEGFTCLDTDLLRTPMRSRVELCDLFGPRDELIHVKWLRSAASASHLFEQARLAATTVREEPVHVLAGLRDKVAPRSVEKVPGTIVLAAGGRSWRADALFTMSKVGLLRLARDVHVMGGELRFLDLPYRSR